MSRLWQIETTLKYFFKFHEYFLEGQLVEIMMIFLDDLFNNALLSVDQIAINFSVVQFFQFVVSFLDSYYLHVFCVKMYLD